MKVFISRYILPIFIVLFIGTGCGNLRIVSKYDSNNPVPIEITRTSYFWGLKQPRDIETGPYCSSICIVTYKSSFKDVFFSAITFGIVVPMTLEYECCPEELLPSEL